MRRIGSVAGWLQTTQIMLQRRANVATLLGLVGLVAIIAFAALMMRSQMATPVAENAAGSDKAWQAVAPGRVEPSSGETKITSGVVALVSQVLVKTNDRVSAGEPLIRLQDDELLARLAAAESQVELRQRLRNDQRASGKAAERRRAEDALSEAETEVYNARSAVDAAAVARRMGSGSDTRLSSARAALYRAQEQVKLRAAALREVEAQSPLASQTEAQLNIARAERSVARAAVDKMTIRAPIAGTVLQVNVKVGETAMPSSIQPLLLIGDVSALRVRAELDDRDVGNIKIGQPVIIRATAFPDRDISGKVTSIAPIVRSASGVPREPRNATDVDVVEVSIDLANAGPLLSGMQVDVYFHRSER